MGKSLFFLPFIITVTLCSSCIGIDGTPTDWWVQLIFPGKFQNGFGYMDSNNESSKFTIHGEKADSEFTALTRTLNQINELQLQTVAWNDEWPNGKTSSSKAHSKGVIAFDEIYEKGFYFGHSIPQYPDFLNSTINTTIKESQSIYGQHVICISLDSVAIKDQLNRILPIKPYIYARNVNNETELSHILAEKTVDQPDYKSLFTFRNYSIGTTFMKFIYKNGALNGSIFEDGLTEMLESPITAETWGRPLQVAWCADEIHHVGNVKKVEFNSTIFWAETQDHSKWAFAEDKDYACFGDMNRMTSQWKRGGAFYCLNSINLKNALENIVVISDEVDCPSPTPGPEPEPQPEPQPDPQPDPPIPKPNIISIIASIIGLIIASIVILKGRLN